MVNYSNYMVGAYERSESDITILQIEYKFRRKKVHTLYQMCTNLSIFN